MKARIGNIIKLALSIGLGLGLLYWFINQMTPEQREETVNSFRRANYFWLLMPLIFGFLSNFSRAQRWRLLLRPLGYNPSFLNTFFSVLTMYFFNLFVPRLGEVSRCGILAKYEDVPVEKSIGTMVVERVVDMITILLLLGFIMIIEYERLIGFFNKTVVNNEEAPAANPLMKFGIPIAIIAALMAASVYIIRKHGWKTLKHTVSIRLKGLWDGVKSIRYLRNFWQFVFHSVFIWICYILMIYLAFRALPETSDLSFLAGVATMVFGGFAMVATPGGIGAYPITVMGVLILYGIPDTIGGALGTLIWALQTVGALGGGIISLIVLSLMNGKKPDVIPSEA